MAKAPAKKARTRRATSSKKAPAKPTARARSTPVPSPVERASVRDTYRRKNGQCTYELADELNIRLMQGVPVDKACDLIGLHREVHSMVQVG